MHLLPLLLVGRVQARAECLEQLPNFFERRELERALPANAQSAKLPELVIGREQ
jgi:hypothetical protein